MQKILMNYSEISMLELDYSSKFKKDYKKIKRQSYFKKDELRLVLSLLCHKKDLYSKHRLHDLRGEYIGYKECHVQNDILLIFRIVDDSSVYLYRIGSHSELF